MSDASHQKMLHIRLTGPDQAIRALLAKHPAEADVVTRTDKGVSIEVLLPESVVEQIDRSQLQVEILYDATARGRERQKEVGQGNRYDSERRTFQGLGTKAKEEPR
jgi:hypothetical protein